MKLLSSPTSPYARKVRIALAEKKIDCELIEASPWAKDDTVSPVSRLIPEPSRQRIAVRRWEALADGICDAAVAIVREAARPAKQQSAEAIARQREKIERGIVDMAAELADKPWCNGEAHSLADIATGCALGYLDLRHPTIPWRSEYANLVALFDKLSKRSSYSDTAPAPA
jgi:glutathione S-transferase